MAEPMANAECVTGVKTCCHRSSLSKSRNVNKGGYWVCGDCGEYRGGVFFGTEPFEPARDVDTLEEATALGIA